MTQNQQRPVALVTGGAVRLGRAIVLALARQGYDIALHYHSSEDAAREVLKEVEALGVTCGLYVCDLSAVSDFEDFIGKVYSDFPRVSLLVNSASVYAQASLMDTTPDIFDAQMAVNLRAPVLLTRAFAQQVTTGQVINILDNKIYMNQFAYTAYLLAKNGLATFTRMAALELAPQIRVNAVAPGVVLPAVTRSKEYVDWRLEAIPLRLQGQTVDVTDAMMSLVNNKFITGQILVVDGGEAVNHTGRNAGAFDSDKV